MRAMAQTTPLPNQRQESEWLMRATVGGTQNPNRSSKTLESMLNNCCVLMNMKQFDAAASPEANTSKLTVGTRKQISTSITGVSTNEKPRLSSNLEVRHLISGQKTPLGQPHLAPEEIEKHNQLYKKNRSTSQSRPQGQGSDREWHGEGVSVSKADVSTEVPYSKPPKAPTEKVKKNGHLLTSFKDMMYMGPFKSFGLKKKTSEHKGEQLYDCECSKDKKLRKLSWESNTGCVRSVGWLRNKYNPAAAYDELKQFFITKMAEKTASPSIKEDIQKDVVRTFNANKYLSQDATKRRLELLLECMALTYPHTAYVQGMNFIAGTLLYHCDEYTSLGVVKILFEQLELKDMFLPSSLG